MPKKTRDEVVEKSVNYEDFITHKPESVRFITKKEMGLLEHHTKIVSALRNRNMTVKEIYKLFYDAEEKKHEFTLKTIYKHLGKLEKANLIKVSGHRVTEGSRQIEKLFSRTANIFFPAPNEKEQEGKITRTKAFAENNNIIMSELLQLPKVEKDTFFTFFRQFYDLKSQTMVEILEKTKTNKDLANILMNISIPKLNKTIDFISTFIVLLSHPQLFDQLQSLYMK